MNDKCPKCDSHELEGDGFDVANDNVVQAMRCLRCHNKWTDVYTYIRSEFPDESNVGR
jgi:predicted Zn-ribbon and HTH transcriptional regulator